MQEQTHQETTRRKESAQPTDDLEQRIAAFLGRNASIIATNRNVDEDAPRESWAAYDMLKKRWGEECENSREYNVGVRRIVAALNV